MHVKIIPFMLYSSCITSARKSLENAKQWWVIAPNLSRHGYQGPLGVESYYQEYLLVQQDHLAPCLNPFMQEGWGRPTPAGLHLQLESATVLSLTRVQDL